MAHSDLDVVGEAAEPAPRRHAYRRSDGSRRSVAAFVVMLLLLGGLAGGVWYAASRVLSAFSTSTPDYAGAGEAPVTVVVKPGDTATDVGGELKAKGVVKSVAAFIAAADSEPASRSLQPGSYRLRTQMKASAALTLLLSPSARLQSVVAVPEGFAVRQTLARIAARTPIPLAQLTTAAQATAGLGLPAYAKGRLEGFLYPATYTVQPGTSARAVLKMMVAKYNAVAAAERLEARAAAVHLTPYQVLTLASLVQKEGLVTSDMPKIARVVYNRLADGQPLGIDAAILYGLGRTGGELSAADLAHTTPYSNRTTPGLPPTPIDSPGKTALDATLAPAPGDWHWYILKDKQGHQFFTNDYQAFLAAKDKGHREGLF